MSQPLTRKELAAFPERAGTLAVASDPPSAQTARARSVPAHTLPPWIGPYPRAKETASEHYIPLTTWAVTSTSVAMSGRLQF